jgi:phycobilisome rod-core linker protein
MAASVSGKGNYAQKLSSFDIDYLNAVPYRGKR